MRNLFKSIQEKEAEIENLNVSKKDKILTAIFAVIMSLITVIGPIGIFINLAILDFYKLKLYVFLIVTLLIIFAFLISVIYLVGIAKGRVKGLYKIYLPETIFFMLVLYAIMGILFIIGVF